MKIGWLPGDGIGVEVLEAARIVLDKIRLNAEYIPGDIGWEFWKREGDALPPRTLDLLSRVDTALFGAITSKPVRTAEKELSPTLQGKGLVYRSPIVRMRQLFDLYSCKRPCKAYPGNPLNFKEGIDITIFRENTEDLYAGVEFNPVSAELAKMLTALSPAYKPFEKNSAETAMSCKINTRKGSERIAKAAFDFARACGKKSVTIVHKANVVRASDGLFLETAREVAGNYPGITTDDANVDALCMWLLKNPLRYQVLVAPNLYGDIISDLCAQMTGGLGFACSGNIGDTRAVFEPTHGSAPKYAGQYKANPIAAILAARMMLEWLGEKEKADKVESAVSAVISEGKIKTYDMGGHHSTIEMAMAVANKI